MSKSPITTVKEKFGDKASLIAALTPLTDEALWLPRVNASKGLARASNAKLLHLHAVLSEVKHRFGSRAKLIDAICDAEKRSKDEGFKSRLAAYPAPRLLDLYRASARRHGIKIEPMPKSATAAGESKAKAAAPKAKAAAKAAPKGETKAPASKKAAAAAPKAKAAPKK
jgi:hypothetical protein